MPLARSADGGSLVFANRVRAEDGCTAALRSARAQRLFREWAVGATARARYGITERLSGRHATGYRQIEWEICDELPDDEHPRDARARPGALRHLLRCLP